jgi:hypothetical protein
MFFKKIVFKLFDSFLIKKMFFKKIVFKKVLKSFRRVLKSKIKKLDF